MLDYSLEGSDQFIINVIFIYFIIYYIKYFISLTFYVRLLLLQVVLYMYAKTSMNKNAIVFYQLGLLRHVINLFVLQFLR